MGICQVYPRMVQSVTEFVPRTTLATVPCDCPIPTQRLQLSRT